MTGNTARADDVTFPPRKMITPYIRKVVEACHKLGVVYEQHSCGKTEPLIPALIATGADTWRGQPINNKVALVAAYGNRFKFAVNIEPTTPIPDEETLRLAEEVRRD